MNMPRLRLLVCATLAMFVAGSVWAQAYPEKPVRVIVPFPPGQGTDVATRYLAERLGSALGRNFLIDNRAGAGSILGVEALARSPADGYTIGIGTSGSQTMNPWLFRSLPYDPEKDFEPITLTGMLPLMVAAHPSFPPNTIGELIAAAKANPDTLNVALPAMPQRLAFELLRIQGGAPLFGVPYKGSASALPEVLSGQVPLIVDSIAALRPYIDTGRLKPLGITSLRSSELMPGVLSVAEQGLEGFELTAWNAFFAPKGTPLAIIERLNTEIRTILVRPETRQRLMALGFEVSDSTPQQLADKVRAEREKWGRIIRAANIEMDN